MDEEGGGTRGREEWSKTQTYNEHHYITMLLFMDEEGGGTYERSGVKRKPVMNTITSPCYYL